MSIIVEQDATTYSFIIFLQTALHVSGDTLTHHREHTQTVITASSSTTADGSQYSSNNARCCNYSLSVLPMMGEGITRNM